MHLVINCVENVDVQSRIMASLRRKRRKHIPIIPFERLYRF